ncbi:acyl-CoA dehydrogenase [Pseudolysinimonas sp.]|uniref:acyl-CoA dehydrogenase n=1 Tax=Pseudolysinimonas sp. TaxID=2680009 RepID=UPI003F80BBBE
MSDYRPPVDDLRFVFEHIVRYDEIATLPGFEHADLETVDDLLAAAGEFMAEAVAPVDRAGDVEGAVWHPDHTVTVPSAYKPVYDEFVKAGWPSIPFPEEFGGGGFPWTVGLAVQEMLTSASMGFSLAPLLTQGAIDALLHYGSDEQKAAYLPRMVSGEWTGTMNLTEPQAGSDVGALTTRAVPNEDGTYAITGQKIYISFGEHDLAGQIVHLVLARTPDAPAGTAGISCFIVPKFLLDENGEPAERNAVRALSIEHKMGIHGSPTCVMEYAGATGYLIGELHKGMRIMFVMMNNARLSVGMEGLAIGERAYQKALAYATERVQGKAVGGAADTTIIDHPDVRRMLMTQRAHLAALRCLMYLNAGQIDRSTHHPDAAARARSSEIVGLLTPVCKAYGTDLGVELSSIALQVFGGLGFVEETGVAQHYRDIRIAPIYEGTNGIQAADLVGRKLPVRGGASVREFLDQIGALDDELGAAGDDFSTIRQGLATQLSALREATEWMLTTGATDPDAVLAGSSPYLRMWGLVLEAWLLAQSALAARGGELAETKLVLARFHAEQLLPAVAGLLPAATGGAGDLFALDAAQLAS